MSEDGSVINVKSVKKSFNDITVLDGLSLDIPYSSVVTIIGPRFREIYFSASYGFSRKG